MRALAVDSLTNFETVKAFAAEERETQRYDGAMKTYNKPMVDVSRSLALLNAGQDIIMALGLTGVAALTAVATFDGRVQAGDMAAVIDHGQSLSAAVRYLAGRSARSTRARSISKSSTACST